MPCYIFFISLNKKYIHCLESINDKPKKCLLVIPIFHLNHVFLMFTLYLKKLTATRCRVLPRAAAHRLVLLRAGLFPSITPNTGASSLH